MAAGSQEERSPYQAVLGDELAELHPRLQAYFSVIPAGHHGFGRGVFDMVGTPRRWLWPALAVLRRAGVVFPVWQRDVPFTVVNRPAADGAGPAINADRFFALTGGGRHMRDRIAADGSGLHDRLGFPARLDTRLEASVVGGALRLRSTRVTFLAGALRLTFPRRLAPVVELTESFDDTLGAQRVTLTVRAPLLGTIYQYAGAFDYEIRPGEPAGEGK
ncbi:DUF4166 domain-containing protein [Diaminobutyricibacter tongyongensis]|uniref:DUF4166 domain-containing protein n=1 Tax=Leifsonia tongyongensis TaxID=1268043 RepID=A0A6L9XYF7_9MICO|nr:DUF4166 domain-containing protein [Diaminobutyricibacter tongyongensis]